MFEEPRIELEAVGGDEGVEDIGNGAVELKEGETSVLFEVLPSNFIPRVRLIELNSNLEKKGGS